VYEGHGWIDYNDVEFAAVGPDGGPLRWRVSVGVAGGGGLLEPIVSVQGYQPAEHGSFGRALHVFEAALQAVLAHEGARAVCSLEFWNRWQPVLARLLREHPPSLAHPRDAMDPKAWLGGTAYLRAVADHPTAAVAAGNTDW
jgi:hypothetical protein